MTTLRNRFQVRGRLREWSSFRVIALFGAVALVVGLVGNAYAQDVVILVTLWGGLAVSWYLLGGFTGLLSLGHGAYFGVGAYATALLYSLSGLPFVVTAVVGMIAAALVGAFIGRITGRLAGVVYALVTFSLTQVMLVAFKAIPGTGGAQGVAMPITDNFWALVFAAKWPYLIITLGYLAICLLIVEYVQRSATGIVYMSVRESEVAAEAYGVSRSRVRTTATAASAALTALGGSIYASYTLVVSPDYVFGLVLTNQFILAVIIGGIGFVWGAPLGAVVVVGVQAALRGYLGASWSGVNLAILGVIFVVIVIFYPGGLAGGIVAMKRRLLDSRRRPGVKMS